VRKKVPDGVREIAAAFKFVEGVLRKMARVRKLGV
jgi:hypothetical protein